MTIAYKLRTADDLVPLLQLPGPIPFQDTRSVARSGKKNSVFYKYAMLEIPTIGSDVYRKALAEKEPLLQSSRGRTVVQVALLIAMALVLVFVARVLWRAMRPHMKSEQ
jgi:hypothetical protein